MPVTVRIPSPRARRAHRRLGGDDELAPVEVVSRESGQGQQEQLWSELQ